MGIQLPYHLASLVLVPRHPGTRRRVQASIYSRIQIRFTRKCRVRLLHLCPCRGILRQRTAEEGPGAWEGDHGRPTRRRARQLAAADEGGLLPPAALGDAAEAHDRQGAGHRTTRPSKN